MEYGRTNVCYIQRVFEAIPLVGNERVDLGSGSIEHVDLELAAQVVRHAVKLLLRNLLP